MEENKDYLRLVTEHIEKDKLLANSNPKYHNVIKLLLTQRERLRKSNGLFAGIRINKINKKLDKFKNTN